MPSVPLPTDREPEQEPWRADLQPPQDEGALSAPAGPPAVRAARYRGQGTPLQREGLARSGPTGTLRTPSLRAGHGTGSAGVRLESEARGMLTWAVLGSHRSPNLSLPSSRPHLFELQASGLPLLSRPQCPLLSHKRTVLRVYWGRRGSGCRAPRQQLVQGSEQGQQPGARRKDRVGRKRAEE